MSDNLSIEQKIDYAVQASDVAVEELDSFCESEGLPLGDVTAWSTAYELGGRLGVQSMVLQWRPTARHMRRWNEEIKVQLRAFRPRPLRVRGEGNRFSVDEVKMLTAQSIVYTPFFQLRVVEEGDQEHWFLYWRRADGSWWPYAGRPHFASIDEAVQEVVDDPYRCFRLHPLH